MAEKEPTWAVVLHTLYETKMAGGEFDEYGSHGMLRSAAIADEVDRNRGEVLRSLSQMRDQGLINEPDRNIGQGYTLTRKGFDVAHTRHLRRQERRREQNRDKRQHDINRAIGFLTVGLLFTGFLQAVITAQIGKEEQLLIVNLTLGSGFLIVIYIAFRIWNSGMLASWDSDASDKDRKEDTNENREEAEDESGNEDEDDNNDDDK